MRVDEVLPSDEDASSGSTQTDDEAPADVQEAAEAKDAKSGDEEPSEEIRSDDAAEGADQGDEAVSQEPPELAQFVGVEIPEQQLPLVLGYLRTHCHQPGTQ